VGKIFDALEKFGKERGGPASDRIKDSDYEALMQFDEATGKIDVRNPKIASDSIAFKRLMTYRLINDDGTLTPAGRAKYDEMTRKAKQNEITAGRKKPEKSVLKKKVTEEPIPHKFEKATQADWALLMNYDRQTGNLLKYDPETGELDEESRNILQDPVTVQRLIDNQMIMPGGWLTPEARRECARMEEKNEKKQIEESEKHEELIAEEKTEQIPEPPEPLGRSDMEALLQHDPETRKLDMSGPLILNDPALVKRLLENNMIEPDGKLTPQALVRCRALTRLRQEARAKETISKTPKSHIREKLKKIAEKDKTQETPEVTAEKKLKIIPLKEDKIENKIEAKIEAKKEEEVPEKVDDVPAVEAKHDVTTPAKTTEKTDAFLTGLEAKTESSGPSRAPSEKRFTLGTAPAKYARREIEKDLVTLMNPQSFEAEQFKILRTNLLFSESGKTPRSVMVTSAMPGEGKSFVAANLAVSVARHVNWNVLLLDCDLRRPSIHRQFGFKNVSGLSDYLADGKGLEQLLLKTGIDNLTILPAGKPTDHPSELLSSARMAALLDEVAARYHDRLIILDSPPPRLTAEAGALARYVDGILVVVKYGSTPKDSVMELIGKLGRDKILGAVVNNFDTGASRYHKKYYGGSYYG
jgi:exopolysaccharide/PEP-CTERM locus tyrosine autokinase